MNFVINRYAITKSVIGARRAKRISHMDKLTVSGTFEYVSWTVSLSCAYAKRGKKKVQIDSIRYFIVVLMIYIFLILCNFLILS